MRKERMTRLVNARVPTQLASLALKIADREARTISDLTREGLIEVLRRRGIEDWRQPLAASE